ncbi:ABC-F family ATP-binding cassette domain-containing protein [Aerococcaceae bacterium DSM 111176]|nr:ABC-F family ATP-binding cassette domain-containing protein [Aerococcaceae bacterium DSM 111176]
MLQIQNLNMYHTHNHHQLIESANFVVNPGDRAAIIGGEGTGKSSLLKWIYNPDLTPDYISVQGQLNNHFKSMAYLPQLLDRDTLNLTVNAFLYGMDYLYDLDFNLLFQAANRLNFDLDSIDHDRNLGQLSGGQQIKLQMIKLMATQPDLYLLDEPSNNLDLRTMEWLTEFIQTEDATFIYVSHDERLLQQTATKVIHLEQVLHKTQPKFTEANLTYQDYVDQRRAKFERHTQVANKQAQEHKEQMIANNEVKQKLHSQLNATKDSTAGRLLAKKMKNINAQEKRFNRESESHLEKPIPEDQINIEFNRVKPLDHKRLLNFYDYDVNQPVPGLIRHINFDFKSEDKVGFFGDNGVGKTSFLNILYQDLSKRTDIELAYMPQDYKELFDLSQTPIEFLTQTGEKEEQTLIMTALGSSLFTPEEMHQPIERLSGGQQAKLFLLKISIEGSNVILLDEPTRNFSPLSQSELRQIFSDFSGGLITISHDILFLEEVCDTIYEVTPTGLVLYRGDGM